MPRKKQTVEKTLQIARSARKENCSETKEEKEKSVLRKKQSKEEVLLKARMARKERYAKIKADPVKYAMEKEKEHLRYLKRKQEKKLHNINEMTPRAQRQQRKKWRENFKKFYRKKLSQKRGEQLIAANSPSCSDIDGPWRYTMDNNTETISQQASNQSTTQALPSLNEDQKSDHLKLKLKYKRLRNLMLKKEKEHKSQIIAMNRKIESYKKCIQRLKKKLQSPNSKVTALMKDKSKTQEIKKKLLFGEAIKKNLQDRYSELPKKEKKIFSNIITHDKKTLKDHKVLSEIKTFTVREKKESEEKVDYYKKLKADIRIFFERDDVSRMTAGKKECITKKKEKKQKRYLTDTMTNLHKLFQESFGSCHYSYFCKQRPFWVLIPDVNNRDTCMCKFCANTYFLIEALQKRKIIQEPNENEIIKSICCSNTKCLLQRCNDCKNKELQYEIKNEEPINYFQWENRQELYTTKGVLKEKRIIEKKKKVVSPKTAVEELEKIMPIYLKHVGVRKWQFSVVHDLKQNLKNYEAIIQVDFSENYAMKYASEVQAFHFGGSRKELTLHTAVIYFIRDDGNSTCKSICTVSENMRHDAPAVWAHVVPLLEYIQTANKNVNTLHFVSDSPSSQYRNKTMFYILSKLCWFFPNLKMVTWNYTEAGHGKSSADGVGGTVKRIADAAVAKGNDIASIDDFMTAVSSSTEKIHLEIVDDNQIYEKDLLIPFENLKPLKGTLKVHQVLWRRTQDNLIFRDLSCFLCLKSHDCNHTTLLGKLSYTENTEENKTIKDDSNKENEPRDFKFIVQPKQMVLQKPTSKPLLQKATSNKSEINSVEAKTLIVSNIVVTPATEPIDNHVTKLSDITPDNKIHLNFDLNDMVSMYNVSGIDESFSGVFEDFVRSKNSSQAQEPFDINQNLDLSSDSECYVRPKASTSQQNKLIIKNDTGCTSTVIDSDDSDDLRIF